MKKILGYGVPHVIDTSNDIAKENGDWMVDSDGLV
jgi:hypothetical protein